MSLPIRGVSSARVELGQQRVDRQGHPCCTMLAGVLPYDAVVTARHFGMKAQIPVDADSGLVRTGTTTAANEADLEQVADLLHGKEQDVYADSCYRGATK